MPREHERIAAVVAGTCEDDDAPAAASGKLAGKLGGGKSCALHELRFVRRGGCAGFERTNLARAIDRSAVLQSMHLEYPGAP